MLCVELFVRLSEYKMYKISCLSLVWCFYLALYLAFTTRQQTPNADYVRMNKGDGHGMERQGIGE